MPAETVHHPSQSQAPEKPQFIVPEEHVKGNIRETIDFGDMKNGQRSDKYNTQGVNLDDEYNAFYRPEANAEGAETAGKTQEKVETYEKALEAVIADVDTMKLQLELLNKEREERANYERHGGLAEDQPRRVRHQDGVTEKLVKYADGSFDWRIVSVNGEVAKRATGDVIVDDTIDGELVDDEHSKEVKQADEDIIDAELVEDDEPEAGKEVAIPGKEVEVFRPAPAPNAPLEDLGELRPIKAAPEQAIEAAPEAAPKPEFQASKESYDKVLEAIDKYAEITAGKRQGYLGHFLEKSKWLVKIPGMQKLADWANDKADAEVRAARNDYETAARGMLDELKQFQAEQEIEDSKERRAEIRAEKLKLLTSMDTDLEGKILAEQLESSGKGAITKKFVDWWVRQEGLGWRGDLKKFLAVAGIGAAAGLAVGAFGLSVSGLAVGALAGGVAGGGLMANVTKRRAGGLTGKETQLEDGSIHKETLAEARSAEDIAAKQAAIESVDTDDLDVSHFTNVVEGRTRDEQIRNRARINKGKGAGALGGGAGSALGGAVRGLVDAANVPHVNNVAPPSEGPAVEAPKTPEFQGLDFQVEDGSGYTKELMDFAQANGHALSPDQSFELHQALMDKFGQDYININGGGNDIYLDNGDVRLAQPGSAEWVNGVPDFVKSWMAARGLW